MYLRIDFIGADCLGHASAWSFAAACDGIRAGGGNITREPGPVKGGNTVIASVTDPDGYKIELIQRRPDRA